METKSLKVNNYDKIKELIRISFALGINLTSPTIFKDSLRIINLILIICSGFSMYGHWCYTTRYFKDISKIAESVCTALQTIVSIIKMIYFLFMQRKLYVLLNQVQTHEILREAEIFNKAFPSLYEVWESKGMSFPYYEIQILLSGSAVYIAGMCAVSFDGVFIVLCVHGVGLIQVLNAVIEKSTSAEIPKERRVEYLRYCIMFYQRINKYTTTIDTIYKQISLSQFILSLIIWGIVLFQMSVGLESNKATLVRMILYLSAAGYEIVIYCFNSQRLTTEYEKVPISLYSCEWYNESEEFKQLIHMMILRTNRIFNLNISWFATMTLATFLAMVQTSGSYFLLLRNLSE